jgi:hypothetical protein
MSGTIGEASSAGGQFTPRSDSKAKLSPPVSPPLTLATGH